MTAQVSEKLIYEGKEVQLHSEPNFPLEHPEIIKSASSEGIYLSTACWRGYVGTWELKDRKLFLNNLQGKYKLKTAPIEADWFSGQLVIPESGKGEYFHGGWGHDYAQNLIVTIVKGMVTNIEYQDKTAPGFIDGWAKTRLNRIFGSIAEASNSCHTQLDEDNENNKLVVFTYEQKCILESMVGKLLVAAQESKITLPISTCLAQPNLIKGNKDHMLAVSVPMKWAVELETTFLNNNWASDENTIDNINGIWHFSENKGIKESSTVETAKPQHKDSEPPMDFDDDIPF